MRFSLFLVAFCLFAARGPSVVEAFGADECISADELCPRSVDRSLIAAGAIGTRKVADKSITVEKLADDVIAKLDACTDCPAPPALPKLAYRTVTSKNDVTDSDECQQGDILGNGNYCVHATCAADEILVGGGCECPLVEYWTPDFEGRKLHLTRTPDVIPSTIVQASIKPYNNGFRYICECASPEWLLSGAFIRRKLQIDVEVPEEWDDVEARATAYCLKMT